MHLRYRTIDGTCNNLKHTWWGRWFAPYKRLGPASYQDGFGEPKKYGVKGTPLPNPRQIVTNLFKKKDAYGIASHLVPVFGQFLSHDFIDSRFSLGKDNFMVECSCSKPSEGCLSIPIPKEDEVNKGRDCLLQVRHRSYENLFRCDLGHREQFNLQTSWSDLSQIYDNTDQASAKLREFKGGRLLTFTSIENPHEKLLPTDCSEFPDNFPDKLCFLSGDFRTNQYPMLTSMHTLFMREHNRVADILSKLNPYWDDETIFQEARIVTIAEYNHMVYNEYLPLLIGDKLTSIFDLYPKTDGYFIDYDPEVFPNVDNELTFAFRFGHLMSRPYVSEVDKNFRIQDISSIFNVTFKPGRLAKPDGYSSVVRGCLYDRANTFKPHVNYQLRDILIEDLGPHNPDHGHSLPTWNINREREHGLQSYNFYRRLAGLKKAKSFDELTHMSKESIESLKSMYEDVNDIDFWSGCAHEYPIKGGLIGPTMAYIIARAFRTAKISDRFFYETGVFPETRIPLNLLNEIKKTSMARIICDNTSIEKIQKSAFLAWHKQHNPLVNCNDLPEVSLDEWRF